MKYGTSIMVLHDFSDPWMEAAKLFNYMNWEAVIVHDLIPPRLVGVCNALDSLCNVLCIPSDLHIPALHHIRYLVPRLPSI